MAKLDDLPVGCKDVPANWPGAVGMRYRVGDDDYHRVGFFSNAEKLYNGLTWRTVQGWLLKGEIEATDEDQEYLLSRGIYLEAVKDKPGFYRSTKPISYKSHYIVVRGYPGQK